MNGPSCLLNFINQQVATYHFHTFPRASLLTNLVNTINIVANSIRYLLCFIPIEI